MTLRDAGTFFGWEPKIVKKSASAFTKTELIAKGFTKEVLEKMAATYEAIAKLTSQTTGKSNPSALGWANQLREILELLF